MRPDLPMNAHEVAEVLGVGKKKVYEMAKDGTLPSYRMGRKLLFRYDAIRAYLDSVHSGKVGAIDSSENELERIIGNDDSDDAMVLCGEGLAADVFIDQLELLGIQSRRIHRSSYAGIIELYIGNADAAIVHLYDQRSNSFNIPYIQRLAPGLSVIEFRLVGRKQGFVVAKGNPKRIASWGALLKEGVRLANRAVGTGSRILLDEKLLSMEADCAMIEGYEVAYSSAQSAMEAVSKGLADVAVVDQGAFAGSGVEGVTFVPLLQEWLDIVVAKRGKGRELVRLVREMLANEQFRKNYEAVTKGDMAHFGSVVYEC